MGNWEIYVFSEKAVLLPEPVSDPDSFRALLRKSYAKFIPLAPKYELTGNIRVTFIRPLPPYALIKNTALEG
jgi:hypothetical protein